MLYSGTKGKTWQWNLGMDPTPRELVQLKQKEMKTNKKTANDSIVYCYR